MKRDESRALARAKRIYQRLKDCAFIKDEKLKTKRKWRACESFTEFLSLIWVKIQKNTNPTRGISDKLDAKRKNRKERYSKKKIIEEGIKEYDARYEDFYSCQDCMFFNKNYCTKNHEEVFDYDYPCEDFFD